MTYIDSGDVDPKKVFCCCPCSESWPQLRILLFTPPTGHVLCSFALSGDPARACCLPMSPKLLLQSTVIVIFWVSLHAFRLVWERDVVNPGYVCGDVCRVLAGVMGEDHAKCDLNHPMGLEPRCNEMKKREKHSAAIFPSLCPSCTWEWRLRSGVFISHNFPS